MNFFAKNAIKILRHYPLMMPKENIPMLNVNIADQLKKKRYFLLVV